MIFFNTIARTIVYLGTKYSYNYYQPSRALCNIFLVMSEVEKFCPYMCDHSSMCFWKCYNFRKFSGHVKLNLSQRLGTAPRPPLPDSPISGPGITMLLVTPLPLFIVTQNPMLKASLILWRNSYPPTMCSWVMLHYTQVPILIWYRQKSPVLHY